MVYGRKKTEQTIGPHPGVLASSAEPESSSSWRERVLEVSTSSCPNQCSGEWFTCQRWKQSSRMQIVVNVCAEPMVNLPLICHQCESGTYGKSIALAIWRQVVPNYYSCVVKTTVRLNNWQPQWHCRNVISFFYPHCIRLSDRQRVINTCRLTESPGWLVQQSTDFSQPLAYLQAWLCRVRRRVGCCSALWIAVASSCSPWPKKLWSENVP